MQQTRSILDTSDFNIDILLIPPIVNPVSAAHISNFIPVGMQALLSSLEASGISAEIYRPHVIITKDEHFEEVAFDILSKKPFALGFSTWCDSFPYSLLIAEAIREKDPAIPIIFGGPQASVLAESCLGQFPYIDYILQGEADRTLPLLIKELLGDSGGEIRTISGLVCRDEEDGTIRNNPPEVIRNMDSLPIPLYESILPNKMVRIDAGRGCPYRCTFCSTNQFFSRKYRVKSVDRLLEEFNYCEINLGARWIGISHDMFTLKGEFIEEFAHRLIEANKNRKKPYFWTCSARTDCVTESLLDLMYESGCRAIFFGLETGSPRIQAEIRKNLDLVKASNMVRHSAELGIFTVVSYMLGFPGETTEDLNRTLQSMVMETAHGAYTQLTLLSLLPGTPIYHDHRKELVYDGSHSGFSVTHPTERTDAMIRDFPEIFSSFYHLPSKNIPRETLLFISDLANYLEHFIPTLSILRDPLLKELPSFDLYGYIEDHIQEYTGSGDIPLPELYFLTDSLKTYLKWLNERDLPQYAWDIFQVDFTKAFMIAKYKRWQLLNAGSESSPAKDPGLLNPAERISRRPYWSIMESHHYIYDLAVEPVRMRGWARFRKGKYHYLVLPVSHRLANIHKIPCKELPVYNSEDKMTIGEIVKKNAGILPEDRILHIIRRMKRLGLIDIGS